MLTDSKKALEALQRVIIAGRYMGYSSDDPKQIADLLDEAEYLVTLILYGTQEEFEEHLDHIAVKFPSLSGYMTYHYKHDDSAVALEAAA
jgi:hypothetical protein